MHGGNNGLLKILLDQFERAKSINHETIKRFAQPYERMESSWYILDLLW